jgi:hypothetical protein
MTMTKASLQRRMTAMGQLCRRYAAMTIAVLAIIMGIPVQATAGLTFDFQFGTGSAADGVVDPPILGTGTFTLTNDPGTGTFNLSSRGPFTMSFTFGTQTFTQSDITSNNSITQVVITPFGMGQERVYFTDLGGPNGAGGPFQGSLDLGTSPTSNLSFEPAFVGGHNLYEHNTSSGVTGSYLGLTLAVLEPSTLGLGAIGAVVAFLAYGWTRHRREHRQPPSHPSRTIDRTTRTKARSDTPVPSARRPLPSG